VTNPFVYGEIVPATAFVDREDELDRLTGDPASRRSSGRLFEAPRGAAR
jgi:hypothetical protein